MVSHKLKKEDVVEICNLYQQGYEMKELSKKYNVSREAIFYWLKVNNIKTRSIAKFNLEDHKDLIYDLYVNQKMSSLKISKQLGVNKKAVLNFLDKYGIEKRNNGDYRIISDEIALEMLELCNKNYKFEDIGKMYGVSHKTVINSLKKYRSFEYIRRGNTKKYNFNERWLDNIDSDEKAYFLGFFYADGYNKRDVNQITIKLIEDDKYLLEKFKDLLGFDENKKLRFHNCAGEKVIMNYPCKIKNQYSLEFGSIHLSEKLEELGCPQAKTHILKFPSFLRNDHELMGSFLRGYIDGDGSISYTLSRKEKTQSLKFMLSFTSTFEVCNGFKEYIKEKMGLNCYVYKANKMYVFQTSNRNNIEQIFNWIYPNKNVICLKRKLIKFLANKYCYIHKINKEKPNLEDVVNFYKKDKYDL